MSDAADTSAEAVEVIAAWHASLRTNSHQRTAATLRALLAEREALREALRAAVVAYTGTKGTQP